MRFDAGTAEAWAAIMLAEQKRTVGLAKLDRKKSV